MLKTILLITPVYVTFFWTVVLYTDKSKQSIPRTFLARFMLVAFVIYLSHFIFYSDIRDVYLYIDPFYQLGSLLVFPLYHIYFRLLTIDKHFSLKSHWKFLLAPVTCFVLYICGVLFSDINEYRMWVFDRSLVFDSVVMHYLKNVLLACRVCFILQVLYVVIYNFKLITKYGHKAKHFYSDALDTSTLRISLLNYSMIVTGVSSIILAALGRDFFKNENLAIAVAVSIFSSMLFLIGWLGDRQKVLNPAYEESEIRHTLQDVEQISDNQNLLLDKLNSLFVDQKIYLNNKLNILDIASALNSNRTYISFLINKNYNQNFCSFVNNYRIQALTNKICEAPDTPNGQLSEACGFGSVDSMKRAVLTKTGLSFQQWKSTLCPKAQQIS